MEMLNRIHLRGIVGSCRLQQVDNRLHANFALVTNRIFKDRKNGNPVVETTWHNVSAFENKKISAETLEAITKGSMIELTGRMHIARFTEQDGHVRTTVSVVADKVTILDQQNPPIQLLEYETEDNGED